MKRPPNSTLVLGLGKTGYSVIEHLAARGVRITAADSRDLPPCLALVRERYPQVTIITGDLPLDRLAHFDRVVISPGLALTGMPLAGRAAGAPRFIGDIELFIESAAAPIIAITGSNGKSTVTMLVSEMLAAAGKNAPAGGNIGTPALQLLGRSRADFYVLELSSFQLENTDSLKAACAAILNISEDHMDRYGHIDRYIDAKARILDGAAARVLNRDDAASAALLAADSAAITFGLDAPTAPRDYGLRRAGQSQFLCRGETILADAGRLAMQGEQNIANTLAAFALVEVAGVALTQPMLEAALGYRGLEHRCELVAEIGGVKWINDSKGTNVGATVAAIMGCGAAAGSLILIAGGVGKGADFSPLKAAVEARASHAVLFGEDAARIQAAIAGGAEIVRASGLKHAVDMAAEHAQAGQTALFSPACASFDMFDNYEQRGHAFKRLVNNMANNPGQHSSNHSGNSRVKHAARSAAKR